MTSQTNLFLKTARDLINDVAIDVGISADEVADPFGANVDKQYKSLSRQLNIAIEELALVRAWEIFKREYSLTTDSATYATGQYPLPTDFHYMIPQTHWDTSNDVPMGGPLSSQDWQYLKGRDLVSSTIYASFRQQEGELHLWPEPPSDGLVISFEYASRNWVRNADDDAYIERCVDPSDTPLFPPVLLRAYLKAKWLASRGFETITAEQCVAQFESLTGGKDTGGPVLNLGRTRSRYPFLEAYRNLPDKGYGS
jgi:hypothetical protein